MWICEDEGVTSESEVGQPTPLRPLGKRGAHPASTRAVGWGVDGTARAIEGVKIWLADGYMDGGVVIV